MTKLAEKFKQELADLELQKELPMDKWNKMVILLHRAFVTERRGTYVFVWFAKSQADVELQRNSDAYGYKLIVPFDYKDSTLDVLVANGFKVLDTPIPSEKKITLG